jgi:two-component system OmpR family sensor kinase
VATGELAQEQVDELLARNAERTAALVDGELPAFWGRGGDLLHLARLDQGRPLEAAPVDLAALAEDAARDARAVQPDRR